MSERQRRRVRHNVAKRMVEEEMRLKLNSLTEDAASEVCSSVELSDCEECVTEPVEEAIESDSESVLSVASFRESDDLESELESATEDNDGVTTDSLSVVGSSADELDDSDDLGISYTSESDLEGDASIPIEEMSHSGDQTLLYAGAQMSKQEFSTCLLSIFLKHSLTYSCVTDILRLFGQVLPSPNNLPQSKHMLFSEFVDYDSSTINHSCCDFCTQLMSSRTCSRPECVAANSGQASFVQVPLSQQLKSYFAGKFSKPKYSYIILLYYI